MDEKTVTMMEGVAREWRVRVQDSAGNVLDPAGFSFYGAAADGVQVPRRMQVHVEGDVAVLLLPGLWMSGRCWRYQVLCQDVLTGVEWVLCQGDVVLERRVACNGPALHEDAVLVDAVLDSELEKVEVFLGDSTAAAAKAARLAEAARKGADEAAARAAGDAARVEDLKRVTLDVAAGAVLSAESAEDSKRGAEAAAGDAAADAQVAEGKAEEARVSAQDAESAARGAQGKAEEARVSAQVAADAASDALAARDEAAAARGGAEEAMRAAGARAGDAEVSAEAASVARAGAEAALGEAAAAKDEAQAAQSNAEEQAAIATAAAEAAQAPESIAAQAARPAVMVLLRDELESLLGDAAAWVVDTDGEKVVVHTDRLDGELLAAVDDILARYVPEFIGLRQHNHDMAIPWREIPDGFTVLDYIEGDGYQRVADVPIDGDEYDRLEIVFANYEQVQVVHNLYRLIYVVTPAMAEMGLVSCNFSDEVHFGHLGTMLRPTMDFRRENTSFFRASGESWCVDVSCAEGQKYELAVDAKKVYLDGALKGQFDKKNEYPHVKFASMRLMNNMVTRFYSARFIDNSTGAVQADMIPCLDSTGAPCLVNRVTGEAFYSVGSADFLYPGKEAEASTFSLRRPVMYGQLTAHGVRRLYRVPEGYNGTREEYAAEFGFKPLVETDPPALGYWEPKWTETAEDIVLEWVETDPPSGESFC